jgi:hypothetical protein
MRITNHGDSQMGMTPFAEWCRNKKFSRASGYRSGVEITKVGALSYVTDEDDAAWQAKLPKRKTSRVAREILTVAECSVKKLAELVDEGKIDRELVAERLSAVLKQSGIEPTTA